MKWAVFAEICEVNWATSENILQCLKRNILLTARTLEFCFQYLTRDVSDV